MNDGGSRLGSGSGGGPGARSRRTRVEAFFTAWPERRTIAPSEAPVRKSTPTSVSRTPRISAPVEPTPRATTLSSWSPTQPPCEEPSASIIPTTVTLSPSLNGLTATSELRVTMSPPSGIRTTGAT